MTTVTVQAVAANRGNNAIIRLLAMRQKMTELTMSDFKGHKDLDAWKLSMDLVLMVYRLSSRFPKEERFCLVAQMRRAASSVPSNIAEGQARGLSRACLNFLRIALASLAELDTQREIALRLKYLSTESSQAFETLLVSTRKLVSGLLRSKTNRLGIHAQDGGAANADISS